MSDVDETMDFEYHSDEDDYETYFKLSRRHKRRHYENSDTREANLGYGKKKCKTTHQNRDDYPVQPLLFPPVENWEDIDTSNNLTTTSEVNHALPNTDGNREENRKKNEETKKNDKSTVTRKVLKGTMKFTRSMHKNERAQAIMPEISQNGWVLFVTELNEEVTEVEVKNLFADYGVISDIRMNLCRRTGFVAGYALIQYRTYEEALKAKEALHNTEFLGRKLSVDWCFLKSPKN